MSSDRPPFNLIEEVRSFVQELGESVFRPEPGPEEDWSNPEYVLGAVLAQMEDLSPQDKVAVLADALTAVIPELRE